MCNKIIQIKSSDVFNLLSEGKVVYRMDTDDGSTVDLGYERAGEIWEVVNTYGDGDRYVYFMIEALEEVK